MNVRDLVNDPGKIVRLGRTRPERCIGGCGVVVWGGECRVCAKARRRALEKLQERYRQARGIAASAAPRGRRALRMR